MNAGDRRLNVDAGGSYRSVGAIENSIIKGEPGRFIKVGDVAKVAWGEAEGITVTGITVTGAISPKFKTIRLMNIPR